jgi:putative FmdB family regulatory protein
MEEWQTITAPPLKKCPECGKNKLQRLLGTGGAIIFKGSGFYITDYRSEGYKQAAKSDSGESSTASKSESADSSTPSQSGNKPDSSPAKPSAEKTPSTSTSKPDSKSPAKKNKSK